ncbi:hypothetical protein B7494_g2304 [Chlorociboria aeruginascens]|nr:hypothetical protein B7494_g2304 [Chlorociboria aeruginascens]
MSSYYNSHHHFSPAAAQPTASSHHSSRGRRAPRVSQNSHKQQFRAVRKEEEDVKVASYREAARAWRSFDLDDDIEFCPNLVTEADMISIHSSSSDRSSLSSGSPESSPQSHQVSPDSAFSLNSNSNPFVPTYQTETTNLKLHQPAAMRMRKPIPIVHPTTGISISNLSSPPQSVSPARMQALRRW